MPKSIGAQLTATLGFSFALLLVILTAFEYLEYDTVIETAEADFTIKRLNRIVPVLKSIKDEDTAVYLGRISHCHEGYILSQQPYEGLRISSRSQAIADKISQDLSINKTSIHVGFSTFERSDFSYNECESTEMNFPLDGMVISLLIAPNQWLNAEIHPHEWHLTPRMSDWFLRAGVAFFLVGTVALIFIRRLSRPFKMLTKAANLFATELQITELEECGPPDVKRAIRSFNMMQKQVSKDVTRRTNTLAAISHDIRSPLTALRVKTELIDDQIIRADHIASIEKMERITASALDFLRGESRNEKKRRVDLGELVDSECSDFRELGAKIDFEYPETILYLCRPDALLRGVRNLLDNAVKYAGAAEVSINETASGIDITVSDTGPGIPTAKIESALQPFERISEARNSDTGGFGLGLAIVDAIAQGHDGCLELKPNTPTGLVAVIHLPKRDIIKRSE